MVREKRKKEKERKKTYGEKKNIEQKDKPKNANNKHPEKKGGRARICRSRAYIQKVRLRN